MVSHFSASYAGRCGICGEIFRVGDPLFYTADDVLTGQDCCGGFGDERPGTSETTPIDRVMPRGKTVRDRCGACFQIPASNGACGCPT